MVNQLEELDLDGLEDSEIDAALEDASGGDEAEQRAANTLINEGAEYDNRGGFVTVYDSESGLPSQVLYYMLPKVLKFRRPDNSKKRVFSLKAPKPYTLGNQLCMLHPSHPMRSELDGMGLAGRTCRKGTLRTQLDVRNHMQHRHQEEWQVIQETEQRQKEEEERQYRRFQMQFMQQQMANGNAPESPSEPAESAESANPGDVLRKRKPGRPRKTEVQ